MQCNDNFLPPESSYCIVLTMLFKYLFMGPIINSHEVKIPSYLYSLLFFVPCSTCNSHRVISCHQTALRRKKKVCITDCIARNSTKITQMNCLQKLVQLIILFMKYSFKTLSIFPSYIVKKSKTVKIEIYLIYEFSVKKRQPNLKKLMKKEVAEQKKKKVHDVEFDSIQVNISDPQLNCL